jgi:hypothetical protein
VIAKTNLPQLLERELAVFARSGKLADAARARGLRAAPAAPSRDQTRSPLIERDLDVIGRLGERAITSITLETDDDSVRRAITPTSPVVAQRLTTMRRLRAANSDRADAPEPCAALCGPGGRGQRSGDRGYLLRRRRRQRTALAHARNR